MNTITTASIAIYLHYDNIQRLQIRSRATSLLATAILQIVETIFASPI